MCDCTPFLGGSDVYDFGNGAKVGAIPNLEAFSVPQQKEASQGEV